MKSRIGKGRGAKIVLVGKLRVRNHWAELATDGRIIIKWIFRK
jgi:hypothetical protein